MADIKTTPGNATPSQSAALLDNNAIQTLLSKLPDAKVLNASTNRADKLPTELLIEVPSGRQLQTVDLSKLYPNPSRTSGNATALDLDSLVAYIDRHATTDTTVWVHLDPSTSALSFKVLLDDHNRNHTSWREHTATHTPQLSEEWKRWNTHSGKVMDQVEFADFLETNLADIAPRDRMPAAGDILKMALEFEAVQDMRVKSHARLQDGGVKLEFVSASDDATTKRMELFSAFVINVPVFWGCSRFDVLARLRYNARGAVPKFWFDLQRPDKVHEQAAKDLISELRFALADTARKQPGVPVFLGKA